MFHPNVLVCLMLMLSLSGCGDMAQLQAILQQTLPPGTQVHINVQFVVHHIRFDGQNPELDVTLEDGQTRRLVLKSDRLKQAVQDRQIGPGSVFRLKNNNNLEIIGSDQLFDIDVVELEGLENLILELRPKEEAEIE